jgi:uncharacterized protein (TIGR02466 family)
MNRTFIFPSEIYETKLDVNNKELAQHILLLEKETDSTNLSNVGGWQSDDEFIKSEHAEEVKEAIALAVVDICNSLPYKKSVKVIMDNGWANVNRFKDYNNPHEHPHCIWSCVYYVQADDDSGNITFLDPKVKRTMYNDEIYLENLTNPASTFTYQCVPQTGKLIVFPSYLTHRVEPNLTANPRISISCNFYLEL